MECVDATWSHAGGISGACSDHGGEASPANDGGGQSDSVAPAEPSPDTATAPQASPDTGPLRPCDQNISADSDTSCAFAENTFYEYWLTAGGDPVPGDQSVAVWSPATQQTYTQTCANDGDAIACSHGDGDEVRFSQASVIAYTQSEAAAYAASGNLGP
ncbi:MAG: hypothetical protein WAL63_17500 [Solirubrobacteraceae bacterium]